METRLGWSTDFTWTSCIALDWLMAINSLKPNTSAAASDPSSQDKVAADELFLAGEEKITPKERSRQRARSIAAVRQRAQQLIHTAFDHIFGTDTIWCKQGGEESRSGSKPPSEISHFTQTSLTPARSPSFSPPLSLFSSLPHLLQLLQHYRVFLVSLGRLGQKTSGRHAGIFKPLFSLLFLCNCIPAFFCLLQFLSARH